MGGAISWRNSISRRWIWAPAAPGRCFLVKLSPRGADPALGGRGVRARARRATRWPGIGSDRCSGASNRSGRPCRSDFPSRPQRPIRRSGGRHREESRGLARASVHGRIASRRGGRTPSPSRSGDRWARQARARTPTAARSRLRLRPRRDPPACGAVGVNAAVPLATAVCRHADSRPPAPDGPSLDPRVAVGEEIDRVGAALANAGPMPTDCPIIEMAPDPAGRRGRCRGGRRRGRALDLSAARVCFRGRDDARRPARAAPPGRHAAPPGRAGQSSSDCRAAT